MTNLDIEKRHIKDKISSLRKELNRAENELSGIDYERKTALYGDHFNCNYCKYNAINDFSLDGWHNLCGKDKCTCCNSECELYEPDDEFSLFIKENIHLSGLSMFKGHINFNEHNALKNLLGGDPLDCTELQEKAIKILTIAFIKENDQ